MEKITKEEFLKRIAKELNDRAQEEMMQELERLQQLDPLRKLSIRVHE